MLPSPRDTAPEVLSRVKRAFMESPCMVTDCACECVYVCACACVRISIYGYRSNRLCVSVRA